MPQYRCRLGCTLLKTAALLTGASLHTGRYPWGIGWYDMSSDGDHCTQEYTLLPELLRRQNYRTHALGKWDVGFAEARCHPTRHARGGYDSWLGYYEACLQDYFTPTFVSPHDVADTW